MNLINLENITDNKITKPKPVDQRYECGDIVYILFVDSKKVQPFIIGRTMISTGLGCCLISLLDGNRYDDKPLGDLVGIYHSDLSKYIRKNKFKVVRKQEIPMIKFFTEYNLFTEMIEIIP
jgi:hypothetical protein